MMTIQIKSCCDNLMWYKNEIGNSFSITQITDKYFWVIDNSGFKNIVYKCDALIDK